MEERQKVLTFQSLNDERSCSFSVFVGNGGNQTLYGALLRIKLVKHFGGFKIEIHYATLTHG